MDRNLLGNRRHREEGQALVEFALSLPVLLLLIIGLIDLGVILFAYSQASNSLRAGLRAAELLGYDGIGPKPYLDCEGMAQTVADNYFSGDHAVTITYVKSADLSEIGCGGPPWTPPPDEDLANGDLLRIEVVANVDPLFLPLGTLQLHFEGHRSIVKGVPIPLSEDPTDTPTNFAATPDCGTGLVDFTWDPLTLEAGRQTSIEIYYADTNTLVTRLLPSANAFCLDCDLISTTAGYRQYYAIAYRGSIAGPVSNIATAQCVTTPGPPINFAADCKADPLDPARMWASFTWDWAAPGSPSRAEIWDAVPEPDVKVADVFDMRSPTCAQCVDITSKTPGDTLSYYIVAVNQGGPTILSSAPSNIAECIR